MNVTVYIINELKCDMDLSSEAWPVWFMSVLKVNIEFIEGVSDKYLLFI